MSRSIHTTRRSVKELQAKEAADEQAKLEGLESAYRQLRRKRLIKREVVRERRVQAPPLAGAPLEATQIEVLDRGRFILHAASAEDIRAVLGVLPKAATEGLAKVQLCLGAATMEARFGSADCLRDPHYGRPSDRIFPGVYAGELLGSYRVRAGVIRLFAYVYEPALLPLPREACEYYLRMQALKTFVHEVAHYHDDTQRVRRGRWLADRESNVEAYAERMEYEWTLKYILPFLREAYPAQSKALRKWVAHRGGLLMPEEFFAGDSRHTERSELQRLFFSTSGAFECWAAEVPNHATLLDSRLEFAWELHYADQYEDCLSLVDRILKTNPHHLPAMALKADTLVHLERWMEALSLADEVLAVDQTNSVAWRTRALVLESRKEWRALLECCARWRQAGRQKRSDQRLALFSTAVAHCALGDDPAMDECLSRWSLLASVRDEAAAKRSLESARRRVLRRAGRPVAPLPKRKVRP